jgi:hypothetical protein
MQRSSLSRSNDIMESILENELILEEISAYLVMSSLPRMSAILVQVYENGRNKEIGLKAFVANSAWAQTSSKTIRSDVLTHAPKELRIPSPDAVGRMERKSLWMRHIPETPRRHVNLYQTHHRKQYHKCSWDTTSSHNWTNAIFHKTHR